MQVTFTNLIKAYSGKCDGLVYLYNRRLNRIIARRMPIFKPHAGTERMASVARNLKSLMLSPDYVSDLKLYTEMHRMQYPNDSLYTWTNLFSKLMWSLAKQYQIDLATISREQISSQNLPCFTLKAAAEAGLIKSISSYDKFVAPMF